VQHISGTDGSVPKAAGLMGTKANVWGFFLSFIPFSLSPHALFLFNLVVTYYRWVRFIPSLSDLNICVCFSNQTSYALPFGLFQFKIALHHSCKSSKYQPATMGSHQLSFTTYQE